jgi:hypothetical protein
MTAICSAAKLCPENKLAECRQRQAHVPREHLELRHHVHGHHGGKHRHHGQDDESQNRQIVQRTARLRQGIPQSLAARGQDAPHVAEFRADGQHRRHGRRQ